MKVHVNLGVATAKELKKPNECFDIGHSAARLKDGILFASFFFREQVKSTFTKPELVAIAAGVHGSGGMANSATYNRTIPDSLKAQLKSYAGSAGNLAASIFKYVPAPDSPKKAVEFKAEDRKRLENRVNKLVDKANSLVKDLESLCVVEKKGIAVTRRIPRVSMNGSGQKSEASPEAPALPVAGKPKTVLPSFPRPAFHQSRRKS